MAVTQEALDILEQKARQIIKEVNEKTAQFRLMKAELEELDLKVQAAARQLAIDQAALKEKQQKVQYLKLKMQKEINEKNLSSSIKEYAEAIGE